MELREGVGWGLVYGGLRISGSLADALCSRWVLLWRVWAGITRLCRGAEVDETQPAR